MMLIEHPAPYTRLMSLSISFGIVFIEMAERRRYEMKKRAERQRETRRRIVEATIELHRTRGPAKTTVSEVAKRAGVNRLTVYNHFPDTTDLLRACSKSWTERHPAPDLTPWAQIGDPLVRLRTALTELYGFYSRTEPMRGNVLRDAETMPELAALLEGSVVAYLEALCDLLAEGWVVLTGRRKHLLATLKLAIDFNTWRSLERESGLSRKEAVETMIEAVRSSASPSGIL
jgi:AcrR family transcriptional regulator